MKKLTPYLLILLFIIAGYFANKEILSQYEDSREPTQLSHSKIKDNYETLLVYPQANKIAPFELSDFNQAIFENKDLQGKWSLIFSGYTNCPDLCPNTLNDLAQLYNLFDDDVKKHFQIIFFSVDPERDTPQRMKAYLSNFHDDFIGISGKRDQIDSLIHQLGGLYTLNKDEGEYYSVDHSGRIFIVDPNASRFGIVKSEALLSNKREKLARELESLL